MHEIGDIDAETAHAASFRDASSRRRKIADVTEWIPDTRVFASLAPRSGMTPGREAALRG